jgi:hypothetical protein
MAMPTAYVAVREGTATWRMLNAVYSLFANRWIPRPIANGKTPRQVRGAIIDEAFGNEPNPVARRDAWRTVPSIVIIGAVLSLIVGVGLGILTSNIWSPRVGLIVAKSLGIAVTAPLLSIGLIWSGRWQVDEVHVRRWEHRGDGGRYTPTPLSQPKDRDFFFALIPWAAFVALFVLA